MKITILVDNDSWFIPYATMLNTQLTNKSHECTFINSAEEIENGDVLFILSCTNIVKRLDKNTHNIVIHASDLPRGRGWSPTTYQILEGKQEIPISLFEADSKIDNGNIYIKDSFKVENTMLLSEIQETLGYKCIELACLFIDNLSYYTSNYIVQDENNASYYKRRTAKDSKIDVDTTINDNFDVFRIADNEKYPVYFDKDGCRYVLKIYKDNGYLR